MSKINIYETGWLNMVFEGRNKAYGAYQLRTENPKTTVKAFFSALLLLGGAAAIPAAISYMKPETAMVTPPETPSDPVVLTEVVFPEEEVKPEETGPSKPITNERMIKYVNMVTADNSTVTEDVPTNDQLNNAQVGNTNIEGAATTTNTAVTTPPVTTGGGTAPSNTIETPATLEMQPEYPGGIGAFLSTVGRNFKTPAVDEEIRTLKVMVYFVIEKDGTISNIRVTRDPGYNLGKEATRVLNSIKTKWSPGYKNGQPVRTAYNLPITINVN